METGQKKITTSGIKTEDTAPLTDREIQMQVEINELKQANEILKDALGFFAKDRKK